MSTDKKLRASFGRLAQRLHNLQFDKTLDIEYEYVREHSINDILHGGILTGDLEDAQSLLDSYIVDVTSVIGKVPEIIGMHKFSSKIIGTFIQEHLTEDNIKQQVQEKLIAELQYYLTELNRLNELVLNKNEALGDVRFSNAGYKTLLNLKVEEVGSLFNLMYESGLIHKIKKDGSKFTKEELAVFIQKNFSCNTSDNIGFHAINNSLNRSKSKAEFVVEEWLEKLLKIVKSPAEK